MTTTEYNARVLAAHRNYADALSAVDIASAELVRAQELLASAKAEWQQLARIDRDDLESGPRRECKVVQP